MKKIILVIFSLIVLSGCSANISLNIDDKNNVTEKIYLYESNDIIEGGEISKEEFLSSTYEFYKSDKILQYNYYRKYDESNFGMEFSRNSKGVCDALETSAFSDFFDKLACNEKDDYYEIKAESSYMQCPEDESECFTANDVTIEVQLPESAISSDADIIEDNKYIWKYTFGDIAKFNLKIKKYKTDGMSTIKIESSNINIWVVLSVILVTILVVIIILFGKYKKNKLKY